MPLVDAIANASVRLRNARGLLIQPKSMNPRDVEAAALGLLCIMQGGLVQCSDTVEVGLAMYGQFGEAPRFIKLGE
jgi:hypothetical protein